MTTVLKRIEHYTGLNTILLIFALAIPLAIIFEFTHASPTVVLITSALAIIPLAGMIGKGTEALAERVGHRARGLTDATLGNAPQLINANDALHRGLIEGLLEARGDAPPVDFHDRTAREPCCVVIDKDRPRPQRADV
mgnify:CR=1 FL=1